MNKAIRPINAFDEINLREKYPEEFVFCSKCNTGTKSTSGSCACCGE